MESKTLAPAIVVFLGLAACFPNDPGEALQTDATTDAGGEHQAGGDGGGTTASGGTTTSGSTTGSGGTTATGGATGSGGMTTTGGMVGSGGSTDSGITGTGGMTGSGGMTTTGGTTGGGSADAGGAASSTGTTFHVFLLLGQSNMAGYPKAQQADRAEDPRVRVLGFDNCAATGRQTDKWDTAAPPLHDCWSDAIGPGDYFAKTIVDVVPQGHSIGLVPCAISGEKIETFLKVGGTKYNSILQRGKLAQQAGGVIEGILFHQGESNNGDSSWPGKVNTLVTDLRADLKLGNIPFLAGELAYSGSCAGHNTLVNKLPSVVSNAFVVSASGLVVDPADTQWKLHFGRDSQVSFGKRYAAKMIEALGW